MTPITEHQQLPDGPKAWPSDYIYLGIDKRTGLHRFSSGPVELFAKRKSCAGWHLRRGIWSYEFVRSEGKA